MNPAIKLISVRTLQFAAPIAAVWLAWQRFAGRPARIRGGDAMAMLAGLAAFIGASQAGLGQFGRPRPLTRLPAAVAFGSIALTFDDGPCPDTTPLLLDVLREHNAKATFFVLLDNAAKYPILLRRIVAEGHTVGVHGVSHDAMDQWTERQVVQALKMMLREIGSDIPTARYFRPPYGAMSRPMQRAVDRMGMTMAMWSVDPKDYESPAPAELVNRVRTRAGHGDIVLLHDCNAATAEALPQIIRRLRGRGFDLVRL